jgi:hypothetical protein
VHRRRHNTETVLAGVFNDVCSFDAERLFAPELLDTAVDRDNFHEVVNRRFGFIESTTLSWFVLPRSTLVSDTQNSQAIKLGDRLFN